MNLPAHSNAAGLRVLRRDTLRELPRDALLKARHDFPLSPILLVGKPDTESRAWIAEGLVDSELPTLFGDARDAGALRPLSVEHERLAQLSSAIQSAFRRRHLFITGASGFLGTRFASDLLRCTEASLTLLRRPETKRALPGCLEAFKDRIQLIDGDITKDGVGLDPETSAALRRTVDEVWHLAACTEFEELLRPRIFQVNVEGTRNVLALAAQIPGLRSFVHVSTAFAAGKRQGNPPLPETLHQPPDEFRNPYEASKYEAEQCVADSGLPWTIYRPSIIVGDLLTGRNDGKTVYNVAKTVRLATLIRARRKARHPDDAPTTLRVALNPAAEKNLIPIDSVTELMLRLAASGAQPHAIFHLTHPKPIRMNTLVQAIARELAIDKYEIVDRITPPLSEEERLIKKMSQVYRTYMKESDPLFQTVRTERFAAPMSLPDLGRPALCRLMAAFFESG